MVARGFRLGSRLILCSFSADASAPSAYTIGHLRWPGVQFLQSRTASSHPAGRFPLRTELPSIGMIPANRKTESRRRVIVGPADGGSPRFPRECAARERAAALG